ncbi:MAG TPA: hypothetical protein VGA66_09130 [Mycobacterium sp.]
MSTVKGLRAGMMASILAGVALTAGVAQAQNFSTERPGSILIFPKVVNTSDTIIQITNTTNTMTYAHCFYVNGASVNGQPLWQVTDFELALTRQQPTHWATSTGRAVNPNDAIPGIDPGLIPPVAPGFTGYLMCVETLVDGTPSSGNSLIGVATIGEINGTGGGANIVSKYNATAIPGCAGPGGPCGDMGAANDGDNILSLDNVEYASCPGGLYFNFQSEGSPDLALAGAGNIASTVSTDLTLVPCGIDFENLIPESTTLSAEIRDEFENRTSLSAINVDCFFEQPLSSPLFSGQFVLPTTFGTSILRPQAGTGFLPAIGVANVLRTADDGTQDTAATNLHFCTDESPPALCVPVNSEIRLPTFQ